MKNPKKEKRKSKMFDNESNPSMLQDSIVEGLCRDQNNSGSDH
jgi:hypothetical protein